MTKSKADALGGIKQFCNLVFWNKNQTYGHSKTLQSAAVD